MGGWDQLTASCLDLSCMGFMRKRGQFYLSLPRTQEGEFWKTRR